PAHAQRIELGPPGLRHTDVVATHGAREDAPVAVDEHSLRAARADVYSEVHGRLLIVIKRLDDRAELSRRLLQLRVGIGAFNDAAPGEGPDRAQRRDLGSPQCDGPLAVTSGILPSDGASVAATVERFERLQERRRQ